MKENIDKLKKFIETHTVKDSKNSKELLNILTEIDKNFNKLITQYESLKLKYKSNNTTSVNIYKDAVKIIAEEFKIILNEGIDDPALDPLSTFCTLGFKRLDCCEGVFTHLPKRKFKILWEAFNEL